MKIMVFDVVIGRSKKDLAKYGKEGTVFVGKQYVTMGQVTSLSNPVYLDVAGAHVVFIVGKRGSGKCVLGKTEITLDGGSRKTIQAIFQDLEPDSFTLEKKSAEVLLKPHRIVKVLSVDNDFNIVTKPILGLYKKKIAEEIVKITTESRKELLMTKEHPLLVPVRDDKSAQYLWKQSSLLTERDYLTLVVDGKVTEEKIVKIEKQFYTGWVYDLTIPETHNFIGNSIICHNSYTMGAIAEGMADLPVEIKQNLSIVLLDTMGIYWTMKYPNFQDAELVHQWGFEPKVLDVKIYTPSEFYYQFKEQGLPTDLPFSIRPLDVGPEDWCLSFELNPNSTEGVLLTRIVQTLTAAGESYGLDDLIEAVRNDTESELTARHVIINQFEKAKGWGIFTKVGTPLKDIIAAGQVTVLDMSPYATMAGGWAIKALVVGLIAKNLFNHRLLARKAEEFKTVDAAMHYFSKDTEEKLEEPLVWLALDEAHELLPREGKTSATDALITILREGRQPGISLILASQQPGKIHTDVMTQADTVIAHRVTAKMDVEALGQLMQSYMREGLDQVLNSLPPVQGAAVIFDDINERLFPVQVRPRFTWHGGGSPFAIQEKKAYFEKALKAIKEW